MSKSVFLEAARRILSEEENALSASEITRRATEKGLLVSKGKTPSQTMGTILRRNIKNLGEKSEFCLVSDGKFTLMRKERV
jgi:hypothetical protein